MISSQNTISFSGAIEGSELSSQPHLPPDKLSAWPPSRTQLTCGMHTDLCWHTWNKGSLVYLLMVKYSSLQPLCSWCGFFFFNAFFNESIRLRYVIYRSVCCFGGYHISFGLANACQRYHQRQRTKSQVRAIAGEEIASLSQSALLFFSVKKEGEKVGYNQEREKVGYN